MSDPIRLAAVQLLTGENVADNADKVVAFIHRCADDGVQLAAFPEGCLFGYTCRQDYWDAASEVAFKGAEARIAAACREREIAVVVGSAHRDEGRWYNSLAIFENDGALKHRYSKTFLAGEKWCGNHQGKLPIVTVAGMPCCFIICHDVRYPELVRLPAANGAKVCVFCSCESGLTHEYKLSAYRAMPVSRATENSIFLIMSNTPADPDNLRRDGNSHGNSKIVHPDGRVLAEAGYFGDTIIAQTVDLSDANGSQARRTYSENTGIRDWFQRGCDELVERIR
ncbi:MAG: carbon-nitrogen hydrolase family protein [Candidatus Poribacteria bacterium]|nr:carbon-nitrogen hydrolase family protein [Candidatus Poribacteria bacterium]